MNYRKTNTHADDGAQTPSTELILAAKMGHEISNLAHGIRSNVKLLRAYWDRVVPDLQGAPKHSASLLHEFPEVLNDVEDGLSRMSHILAEMKSVAGGATDAFAPVRLEKIIEAALRLIKHDIAPDMSVMLKISPELPDVNGSEHQLCQVFTNLLSNAAHAACKRGAEKWIRIEGAIDSEHNVVITVTDSGPGILPDIFNRLFSPFVTSRRGQGGTGLGLFISREIVQRHGGRLNAINRPGEGAMFEVVLPAIIRVHRASGKLKK